MVITKQEVTGYIVGMTIDRLLSFMVTPWSTREGALITGRWCSERLAALYKTWAAGALEIRFMFR